MKPFPDAFSDSTLPLGGLLTDKASAELIQQLAAKNYEVHLGLTPQYADSIAKIAEQPSLREYVPRDLTDRFASHETAQHWLSKGRAVFLLFKKLDYKSELQLAGYGWSGRSTSPYVPEGETTFALRISETNQGQGLATPFATLILSATEALYGAPNIWLETWASNGGAVHTYHKLGFAVVNERPGERPTQAGPTVPDVRMYMTRAA